MADIHPSPVLAVMSSMALVFCFFLISHLWKLFWYLPTLMTRKHFLLFNVHD